MTLATGQGLGGSTARLFGLGWEFGGSALPFDLEVWPAERRQWLRAAEERPRMWQAERRNWLKISQMENDDMRPQIDKDPWEEMKIGVDFANRPLDSGEWLESTGSSVLIEDSAGVDVTADMLGAGSLGTNGTIAYCMVKGGIVGETYTAYFQMVTNLGQKLTQGYDIDVVRG